VIKISNFLGDLAMKMRTHLTRWLLVVALLGSISMLALVGPVHAQTVVEKRCSNCNQVVPIGSQVGSSCPHCHAGWSFEQTHYVDGGGTPGGYGPQNNYSTYSMPAPLNPPEETAARPAWWAQEPLIQRQMLLERYQQQREAKALSRARTYQRLRERTERSRESDEPLERADRYLASAFRNESQGNIRGAVAYYALVVHSVPGTSAAAEASAALNRLGAE
jgi:hypothetical protein